MFCERCGAPMGEGARFCARCGARARAPPAAAPPDPRAATFQGYPPPWVWGPPPVVLPPRPAPAGTGRPPAFTVGVFFVITATAALLVAWSLAQGGAHDSSAVGYVASAVLWLVAGAFLHIGLRTPRAPSP